VSEDLLQAPMHTTQLRWFKLDTDTVQKLLRSSRFNSDNFRLLTLLHAYRVQI